MMENWDSVKQNVEIARNSEGTLQSQADTYAESWEAASYRVKAATEGLFDTLISDDLFIGALDGIAALIGGVDSLVGAMGGLKTIIPIIGALFLKNFSAGVPGALRGVGQTLMDIKTRGQYSRDKTAQQNAEVNTLRNRIANDTSYTDEVRYGAKFDAVLAQRRDALNSKKNQMTQDEFDRQSMELDMMALRRDDVTNAGARTDEARAALREAEGERDVIQARRDASQRLALAQRESDENLQRAEDTYGTRIKDSLGLDSLRGMTEQQLREKLESMKGNMDDLEYDTVSNDIEMLVASVTQPIEQARVEIDNLLQERIGRTLRDFEAEGQQITQEALGQPNDELVQANQEVAQRQQRLNTMQQYGDELFRNATNTITSSNRQDGQDNQSNGVDGLYGPRDDNGSNDPEPDTPDTPDTPDRNNGQRRQQDTPQRGSLREQIRETFTRENAAAGRENFMKNFDQATEGLSVGVSGATEVLGAGALAIGMVRTLGDESATTGEKIASVFSSTAAGVPMAIDGINAAREGFTQLSQAMGGNQAAIAGSTSVLVPAAIAIGALVTAFLVWDNLVETNAEKVAKLKQAQQDLASESQKATQEAENLKAALDGYDAAEDKLKKCARGTEEWANALNEVQAAIDKIGQAMPNADLGSMLSRGPNGELVLDTEKVEQAIEQAETRANETAVAANFAGVGVKELQVEKSIEGLGDKAFSRFGKGDDVFSAQLQDALTNSVSFEDFVQRAQDAYEQSEYAALRTFDSIKGSLQELYNENQQLRQAESNNYQKLRIKTEQKLGDTYGKDGIANDYAAAIGNEKREDYYKQYLKDFREGVNPFSGTDNEGYKTALKIMQDAGYNYSESKGNAVIGSDTKRKFTFTDDSTGKVTEAITAEFIANLGAAQKVMAEAGQNAANISKFMLDNKNNGLGNIASSIAKAYDGSEFQLDSVLSDIKASDIGKITGLNEEQAIEIAANFKTDQAEIEAFAKQIQEQVSVAADEAKKEKGVLSRYLGDETDISELSVSTITKLNDQLTKAAEGGQGFKGTQFMSNFINQLVKGAKPEDAAKIMDVFANIDWTQWDAVDQLKAQLESLGITINGIDWSSMADGMRQVGLASPVSEFAAMASALETIIGLLDKLKVGAKLTGEEMEAIKAKLPNWQDYFIQTGLDEWTQIADIVEGIDAFNFDTSQLGTYGQAYEDFTSRAEAGGIVDFQGFGDNIITSLSSQEGNLQKRGAIQAQYAAKSFLTDSQGNFDQNMLSSLGYTQDAAQALVDGTATIEQMTAFIQALQQFAQEGAQSQGYNEDFINQMKFQTASSVVDMQGMDGFYKDNGDISDGGVGALQERASQLGDEGAEALKAYQAALKAIPEELRKTAEGEQMAAEAANKFKSELQDIEAEKVAKDLRKLTKEYGKLTNEAEKTESLKKQKDLLDQVFGGKGIDTKWIKENQKTINKWLNGTQEEMEEAGQEIMKQAGTFNEASAAYANEIKDVIASSGGDVTTLAEQAAAQLGMTAGQAQAFAQNFAGASTLVQNAIAQIDGKQIAINGYADMSGIIKSMMDAGATAQDVASLICGLSMSGVTFAVNGDALPQMPAAGSDYEAYVAWAEQLMATTFDVNSIQAEFPADAPTPKMAGGGGGSGGGGGAKQKKKVDRKEFDKEQDRYHVIKNQLEDITAFYDKVSAARDRAFGKANLDLLQEEIGYQEDLIAGQEQYISEIEDYLQKDKSVMANYGAVFDENGTITNYDQLVRDQVDKFNRAADEYEASAQEEGDEERWKQAQEAYQEFQDALDQYDETQDLLKEAKQELFDKQAELYDKLLESTEIKVELRLDLAEDEIKRIEFLLGNLEDDAFAAAEKIALIGEKAYDAQFKLATYRNGLNEIFSRHGIAGALEMSTEELIAAAGDMLASEENISGFTADEIDTMREYVTSMIDETEALVEARKEVFEALGEQFEAGVEELDLMIEKQEHLQTMAESYTNIIDIIGKRQLGMTTSMVAAVKQTQVELAKNRTAMAKDKEDAIRAELEAAREARQRAAAEGLDNDVALWDEQIKTIEEAMREAEETTLSALEDSLSAIQDLFESTFESIVDDFKASMGGMAGHMDVLQDQFDRSTELNNKYVEPYEKVYELTKLIREAGKSIDNTDNVRAQKELLALQQEFMDLRNSDKELSEYDLNYLRLRYEAKVAEMALDEAKNAKSQVRMTRDNNGNFSYVYTASDDDVASAEQAYEDKLYQMQVANGEYLQQLQEDGLNLENTYLDSLQNIKDTLTIGSEEYYKALEELNSWYTEMVEVNNSQMGEVISNNNLLYQFDIANYNAAMQAKALEDTEYISKFSELPIAILAGYETMEEMTANHNAVHQALLDQLSSAELQYVENNKAAMKQAGMNYETFSEDAANALKRVENESEELKDEMEELAETIKEDFVEQGIAAVERFSEKYSSYIDLMIEKTDALVEKFNKLVEVWADINKEAEINTNWEEEQARRKAEYEAAQAAQSSSSSSSSGGGGGGGSSSSKKSSSSQSVPIYDSNGKQIASYHPSQVKNGNAEKYANANFGKNNWSTSPTSKKGFDTGGYTGEWGPEGKEAILHEKELVLNKTDTENILSAVDMVRQISKLIDMSAAGMMTSSLLSGSAQGGFAQMPLEQQVHITAEFPNATDRNEILAAFDNIVNLASQYAGSR